MNVSDLYSKEIEVDVGVLFESNIKAKISFTSRYGDRRNTKRNLVFINGEMSPEDLPETSPLYNVELVCGPRGDELIDKVWDRYNRKEVKIMKAYLNKLACVIKNKAQTDETFKALNYWIENSGYEKAQYNAYAGCSMCKCSPGFVLRANSDIKNIAMHLAFERSK